MTTNYTDETTGIEYFGIATYRNVNTGAGSIIFPENDELDRCLSKRVADESSGFNYVDDGDEAYNRGKLLKYSSINFFNTIPLRIYNNRDSYAVSFERYYFKLLDNNSGKTESVELTNIDAYIYPGYAENFTIKNIRDLFPVPSIFTTSGNITLSVELEGTVLGNFNAPISGRRVTCKFYYHDKNGTISAGVTPNIGTTSGSDGKFKYTASFNLSWTFSEANQQITYFDPALNDVWPVDATKLTIEIYA